MDYKDSYISTYELLIKKQEEKAKNLLLAQKDKKEPTILPDQK